MVRDRLHTHCIEGLDSTTITLIRLVDILERSPRAILWINQVDWLKQVFVRSHSYCNMLRHKVIVVKISARPTAISNRWR